MTLNPEWLRRVEHWRNTMPKLFYRQLQPVEFEGFTTPKQFTAAQAEKQSFKPMPTGTHWGKKWEYAWFRANVRIPREAAGRRVALKASFWKGEGWGSSEAAVYINGRHAGARDLYHQEVTLSRKAGAGEKFHLLLEAYAGHGPMVCGGGPCPHGTKMVPEPVIPQCRVGDCSIGIWEEELYQLWLDTQTLFELRESMADKESLRIAEINHALRKLTLAVDLELPRDEMMKTVAAGRKLLKPLLQAQNGSTAPFMHCFGHSHIDVAWLWPLRETESKCARTFGTQLALMEEYPEYKFLQSQCHLYQMVKNHYPKLYARIKEAVKRGQWTPDGGMWVESDTNVPSGESLIRQFMHGKRFYREEFNVESELMWLPDVFGYSGAMPQIMKGCDIKYFSTQKIFWTYNGGDPFPYNLFWWEGIDGTRVLSYLHNDYNSLTSPTHIITRWNERVQKGSSHPGRMVPFGYGDGGGGSTRDHLEYLRRMKNLEGCPKCSIDEPTAYFNRVSTRNLPSWVGELYFQAHRGTYTTQAKTKKGNRLCEWNLREVEFWGAAASLLAGFRYPLAEADQLWKTVLLNQFHDIIPGSSIHRVYEEAEASHAKVIAQARQIAANARAKLTRAGRESAAFFNSLSWQRRALVELPRGFEGAATHSGAPLPVQTTGGRSYALAEIPSCGWTTLRRAKPAASIPSPVKAAPGTLENEFLRATFNEQGEITSLFDKESGRELAAAPCNSLRLYKDVPSSFDAWDIDSMYKQQPVELEKRARLQIGAKGPLFASLKLERKINQSTLTQEIILCAGSRRLDFRTVVDWRESHKLLKVNFPVTVRAEDALQEIQFGHVRRPTHATRPYDASRFEVCNQKWTALAEENRGAAVLNDCKYGVSVEDNSINLTLLRAPLAPDMTADLGVHEFTYSFYAWNGPFIESRLIQESYELNIPVTTQTGAAGHKSLFEMDSENVVIETVKPAEDGSGDIVLRLYEARRASTRCRLTINLPFRKAVFTNMLEEDAQPAKVNGRTLELSFKPFEIKTLRLASPNP
ncbi:MAG: glycoside hydrolase family 38 C-terminal domain-containing protein [Verrucomicrobiae bacterium]|nr:glycoside hydrolase family 38 C-terminal domain-containing protein [Verrucomicrobiae bacterium]